MNGSNSHENNESVSQDISGRLDALGLNAEKVQSHQKNVVSYLSSGSSRFFKIVDSCRLDNEGIRPLPDADRSSGEDVPVVAFIPAAGASSRYLSLMEPLFDALRQNNSPAAIEAVKKLVTDNVSSCPLPESFHRLLEIVNHGDPVIPADLCKQVLADMDAPKALYPAVKDGMTFLEMKRVEHHSIGEFSGEIFVCPPGKSRLMGGLAQRIKGVERVLCYEQGPALATVRFDRDGQFALDGEGNPSPVPAGHGSLIQLFPRVRSDFPDARGLFIRNIDNVSGTSKMVVDATRNFIGAFRESLRLLDAIRLGVGSNNYDRATESSRKLLNFWNLKLPPGEDPCRAVLSRFFHASPSTDQGSDVGTWNRPFVLMGQVPNTQKDVGGTCVFAQVGDRVQKLCLELPHAAPDDRRRYLEDPTLATHFNPVFVAAEIPNARALASWEDHPFWLIAKKTWRGRDVYYQESILYELLGSSSHCNVVFTEVPRVVFNPHKTLFDASGKMSSFWLGSSL